MGKEEKREGFNDIGLSLWISLVLLALYILNLFLLVFNLPLLYYTPWIFVFILILFLYYFIASVIVDSFSNKRIIWGISILALLLPYILSIFWFFIFPISCLLLVFGFSFSMIYYGRYIKPLYKKKGEKMKKEVRSRVELFKLPKWWYFLIILILIILKLGFEKNIWYYNHYDWIGLRNILILHPLTTTILIIFFFSLFYILVILKRIMIRGIIRNFNERAKEEYY